MRKISIKNIYLILVISIGLIVLGIGSTYAMFTSSSNIDNPISLSSNLTYSSDIFESFDINLSSKESKTIKLNINNNTNISNINYASWYIYEGNNTDLTFYTIIDNSTDIEPSGTLSTSGSINIKIVNNTTSKVSLTVGVSSNKDNIVLPDYMKLITINKEKTLLADYITNLYNDASKTTVTNNSITYNYASSVSLMNDRLGGTTTSLDGGNIRYYGASPNNYIYFNCETYPDTNCELWRIIGVFDGKVKIMRNESIGSYSWNTSSASISIAGWVDNEWSEATAMKLLNPGYDSESTGGSLYYNNSKGRCYNGRGTVHIGCDFTSTGIKNDTTRNKIAKVTWNLGGWNHTSIYSNQFYEYERGTTVYTVYSGRSTTWPGKITLPYPSDYGYAADFNSCSMTLFEYSDSTCTRTNWMYHILSDGNWFLMPGSNQRYLVYNKLANGNVILEGVNAYSALGLSPTLFLNSSETIVDGTTGSQDKPYKLNP